jgi:hypothetical protein
MMKIDRLWRNAGPMVGRSIQSMTQRLGSIQGACKDSLYHKHCPLIESGPDPPPVHLSIDFERSDAWKRTLQKQEEQIIWTVRGMTADEREEKEYAYDSFCHNGSVDNEPCQSRRSDFRYGLTRRNLSVHCGLVVWVNGDSFVDTFTTSPVENGEIIKQICIPHEIGSQIL